MTKASVTVLGGDLRGRWLAEYMEQQGHEVTCFHVMDFPLPENSRFLEDRSLSTASTLKAAVSASHWILGPMPFSRDGVHLTTAAPAKEAGSQAPSQPAVTLAALADVLLPGQILAGGGIPEQFFLACARRQITVLDLLEDEALTQANAVLTAEGLLSILIAKTSFSLVRRKFLILGFGRCGKEIARLLSFFSRDIFIYDKNPECMELAGTQGLGAFPGQWEDYDVVINTIPAQVLTEQQLARLPAHCMLFDIASAPFGFHQQTAHDMGLTLIRCPGIPGAMMPKTAGEMIGRAVSERMLSHGF